MCGTVYICYIFLYIFIVRDAQLVVIFDLGGGTETVTSTTKLDNGTSHKIQIYIKQQPTASVEQSQNLEWNCTIHVDKTRETSITYKHVRYKNVICRQSKKN